MFHDGFSNKQDPIQQEKDTEQENGNIFNANAPRPSSDDIRKELNKALAI